MADMSSLFSGLYGGGGSSWLSDWASIKSGAYGRLMKSYYGKATSGYSSSSSTGSSSSNVLDEILEERRNPTVSEEVQQANEGLTAKIPTFRDAVNNLQKGSLYEDSKDGSSKAKDKVLSAVKSYVSMYNDVVSASKKSTLQRKTSQIASVMRATKENADKLAEIGITISYDGTLTLNESKLKSADLSQVQDLFSADDAMSYGSVVMSRLNFAAVSQGATATESGKTDDAPSSAASDLQKDGELLTSDDLFKKVMGRDGKYGYDVDSILSAVNSFIDHFNEMLDAGKSSGNSGVNSNIARIKEKASQLKDKLYDYGIDVQSDGKLKLNEFRFRNADMSMFRSAFQEFYGGISSNVDLVDYYMTTKAGAESTYKSDGTYDAQGSYHYSSAV